MSRQGSQIDPEFDPTSGHCSGPQFQVAQARPAHWRRVREIRLRALADAPDAFGSTLASEQRRTDAEWRLRIENERVGHFLATSAAGDDLGIAVGAPFAGQDETAGLFAMWVAPEARRQRIGAALVSAVIAWARDEAYRRVVLDVATSNLPAIRLYESCGFTATGRTRALPPPREQIREREMAMMLD